LDLVKRKVDLKTGKLASSGSRLTADMWFRRGTEPRDAQPEKNQVDPNRFMQLPN
jgi:penicillin-binding protein 1A